MGHTAFCNADHPIGRLTTPDEVDLDMHCILPLPEEYTRRVK